MGVCSEELVHPFMSSVALSGLYRSRKFNLVKMYQFLLEEGGYPGIVCLTCWIYMRADGWTLPFLFCFNKPNTGLFCIVLWKRV